MIAEVNGNGGSLSNAEELWLKIAAPQKNMVDQVVFGWLADKYGRKKIYGVELIINECKKHVMSALALKISPESARRNVWPGDHRPWPKNEHRRQSDSVARHSRVSFHTAAGLTIRMSTDMLLLALELMEIIRDPPS